MSSTLSKLINGKVLTVIDGVESDVSIKQYVAGTSYANGTPLITSGDSGFTLARGVLLPYRTFDGTWRLRANIFWNVGSSSTGSVSISGIISGSVQTYVALNPYNAASAQTSLNAGTNTIYWSSINPLTQASIAFDIELESKPTWAD